MGIIRGEIHHKRLESSQKIQPVEETFAASHGQQSPGALRFDLSADMVPVPCSPLRLGLYIRRPVRIQRFPVGQGMLHDLSLQPTVDVVPEASPVVPVVFPLFVHHGEGVEIHSPLLEVGEQQGVAQVEILQFVPVFVPGGG